MIPVVIDTLYVSARLQALFIAEPPLNAAHSRQCLAVCALLCIFVMSLVPTPILRPAFLLDS